MMNYKGRFFDKLRAISPPLAPNITWSANPPQLTCCIVEPRIMMELRGVLYNVAKIYGNKNVGLTIYHGTNNEAFVKEIIKGWENVVLHNLNMENLKISEYSNLLTKKDFYKDFTSSHVLIFQTDSYIFRQIPQFYYQFDYVGAPWCNPFGNGCGNGGISLRNVNTMVETTTIHGIMDDIAEDIYFSRQELKVCKNKKKHENFSVEHIFNPSAICCHQPYHSMKKIKMKPKYLSFLDKII